MKGEYKAHRFKGLVLMIYLVAAAYFALVIYKKAQVPLEDVAHINLFESALNQQGCDNTLLVWDFDWKNGSERLKTSTRCDDRELQ